uniref:hypothetical protein n=1 Tax=Henriciella pelagia TaxID=1977912 RepID=UPI00351866BE
MLHASTQKLIDRLAAMTAQKKIDWIEKDSGEVLYATEGYVVRLTAEPPRVLLTTESGKSLEDATSTLLNSAPHADGGTYGDLVASIARDACREARGTEEAINTLLAGLSDESDTEITAGEDGTAEDTPAEEADPVTAAEDLPGSLEDSGDDTELLSGDGFGESQHTADAPEAPTPSQELTDESVPEAAVFSEADDTDAAETIEASDAVETEPEDDVEGAVARLADEVNNASEAAMETVAEEAETVEGETESPQFTVPAFSVMPDSGETFAVDDDASDETVDTLAQSDLPATEDAEEELMGDLADAPAEAEPAETEEPAAPAIAAVEDAADEVSSEPAEPAPAETNVRYVPFGAGVTQAVGADISEEQAPIEESVSSELGAAASDMSMPVEAQADALADTDLGETGVTGTDVEVPGQPSEPVAAPETPVSIAASDIEPTPEDETPSSQPTGVMSISGFSAGLGFGAKATGFTPQPPRPAEPSQPAETVTRAPGVIEAPDDYPEHSSAPAR